VSTFALNRTEVFAGRDPFLHLALILSPTRELALQTWKEAQRFGKLLGIKAVCVYGGVGISEQIADLKRGAEVVVCTPGRMIDMLAANHGE
jgi:ATP-dependent RNA helicase DDX46/PRP5